MGSHRWAFSYTKYDFYSILEIIIKIKIHSSCDIEDFLEDFVETHLCKLCAILRSRVLVVAVIGIDISFSCFYSRLEGFSGLPS